MSRRQDIIRRLLAADDARQDVLHYTRFTMPDPKDPAPNPRTRYLTGRHHELLARKLHDLKAGRRKRIIVNMGPRHGKTELASKRFMSWWSGHFADRSLIFGTYNEQYAGDIGRAVREIVRSPEHQLVFPGHALREDSQAANRLMTSDGGQLSFVGRGGSITGRGGHGLIIDDPIKDREEADSKRTRDKLWEWFTQVIGTRLMDDDSWIMVIQTRWHEDDLVGRLTDPMSPFHDKEEAAEWEVIDLPAIALEDDILGRKPGEPLWPEKFGLPFLNRQKRMDPRGFQALYQGRPSVTSGNFFQADWLRTYKPDELPTNLRYYAASDHAVSTQQARDKTCLLPVGVDERDNIYVLPSVAWGHFAADRTVDEMLSIMRAHAPVFWWAERGQITKALGPFLRKRMHEEGTYSAIVDMTPTADKQARAQSIAGRMSMGKVYFPSYASWWPDARDQLLKFPQAAHDDFVDALAWIGLGLSQQTSANRPAAVRSVGRPGTFARLFASSNSRRVDRERAARTQGW